MAERDYLVVYEEEETGGLPADDSLVLDIESQRTPTLGELDVEQRVDLELTNKRNWMGTTGFATTCAGSALGLGLMAVFAWTYPEDWYTSTGNVSTSGLVGTMVLLSIVCVLLLSLGTVLTHYGRRIQARGKLSRVRIVEKSSQPHAQWD